MKVFYLFLFLTPLFAQGNEKGQNDATMGIIIRDVKDVILDLDSKLNDEKIPDRYKVDIRNIRNKICISEGVCIVNVEENSLAYTSGFNVLDVIVAIDNEKVNSLCSFNKIMEKHIITDSSKVTVNRNCIENIIYLVPSRPKIERVLKENIEREYDEFTGETMITARISGPIDFVKTISETGDTFILLKWSSYSNERPGSGKLKLTILFDDNSRLSINLPIVSKYNEFWTSVNLKAAIESETIMDPTMYSLRSEVILASSQIAMLRNKAIKKYRLEGYSAHEIYEEDVNSKIIFNELLNVK